MISMISKPILDFADFLSKDQHQRYRSWEHCYSFFRIHNNLKSDEDIDLACLHLGFYLASWGMYRGSSFLLQKDYKIHKYAITVLLNPKYRVLWDLDLDDIFINSSLVDLIFDLKEKVVQAYVDNISEVDGVPKEVNVTDALITKILMGTMGCTPAYDRFFVIGLKENGFKHKNFNKKSFYELLEFYRYHSAEFTCVQKQINKNDNHIAYPIMKIMDMYFWQLGYMKEKGKV